MSDVDNVDGSEHDGQLPSENLNDFYEYAPCGYCSCLPDGVLVKVNQTLLGWLGYTRQDLVARQDFQQLLTMGGRLHYETYCVPLLLLQGQVREISYQLRRKDGSTLPVLMNAVLLRAADGQPLGSRITLFDITDRRKFEQELLRAKTEAEEQREQLARANEQLLAKNEELLRINADLDSFVYTASHDLKQPIDNMAGLFAELKRTATFHDQAAASMVGMFEEALRQILGTISDLTTVVQQQRELKQAPEEVLALQPITEEIVSSLQANEPKSTFMLDFSTVPTLRASRPILRILLYNLLSNALKYADASRHPYVKIYTVLTDGATVLCVQDNGRGIDLKRHGQELFQLFRRFHPEVAGSGVGLYLVNRLVHQVGGRVEVHSTVGKGTTFRVYLPQ